MCNVFIAISKYEPLDVLACLRAMDAAKTRGPDFRYYNSPTKNLFLGCDVLSITGSKKTNDYYRFNNTETYLNGEIYNLNLRNESDTQVLSRLFDECEEKKSFLNTLDGMFGLVFYKKDENKLYCARDVAGEKTLYVFEDNNTLVITSSLACVHAFVKNLQLDTEYLNRYLHTRHLLSFNKSIYKNVYQIEPGTCVIFDLNNYDKTSFVFDSIEYYFNQKSTSSEQALTEELDFILNTNIKQMLTEQKIGVNFSGGIDSSLIAWYIASNTDNYNLVATNCIGKDYISNNLRAFEKYFTKQITTIDINAEIWFNHLNEAYNILQTPLPSHSFLTQLIYSKFLQTKNVRVNYTGVGADEIFGGYAIYNTNINNKNVSPYSSVNKLPIKHDFCINRLVEDLDKKWKTVYNKTNSNILAMSYADTAIELVDDGLRSSDQITSWYGIESRSPFMRKNVLKFAFSLPEKYKRNKPLLKNLFKQKFPDITLKDKQGFAGFPNEAKQFVVTPYTDFTINSILNIKDFNYTKSIKWKLLNLHLFYESYCSRLSSITSR